MKKSSTLILSLFLLGIFMGAIDSGIVTPARELIQNSFGVERNIGTWMLTLYTLVYAVSMPIVSKMADRFGFKKVYLFGIAMFGFGSLLCGLTNFFGNFSFFLGARVVQAIGAGGILPIANAFIGRSFPEEKRGMALGMVGAIYGVATILGPTLGSTILNVAGVENWGWLFFINLPITILIIALSYKMENIIPEDKKPIDFAGSFTLAVVVGSLMYALTKLDFFHFNTSIKTTNVYPFLIIFVLLTPVLIYVEKRAKDPILNLKYFKNRQLLVIMILAFIVGIGMMGMVFVPQFGENALRIKSGSGGYLVTLLAVFSGIAAPISGKLLDKKGVKVVMFLGFLFTISGTLFLGFVATKSLTYLSVFIGLALMGLGVGFTMGAPLNYAVLQAVPENESASGLATMSLVRSIGVAISPSIMIGFIVNAGKQVQTNLMVVIQDNLGAMMPKGMNFNMTTDGSGQTQKLFQSLQNSDVTTIMDNLKNVLKQVIGTKAPAQALAAIDSALSGISSKLESVFQATMNKGYGNMFTATAIIAAVGLVTTFLLVTPSKNKTIE